jgi:DNA helicase HerA-like ATPase
MKALLERGTAEKSPLVSLLVDEIANLDTHDSRRVGFTLSMDYSEALVMVHDKWRSDVEGIPHNSYLLAATFNPADFAAAQPVDRRVILLRVTGRAPIETDSEHLRAITQFFQDNPDVRSGRLEELEPITVNRMSWTGMKGHILGTFFVGQDGELRMGTDIEDVFATRMMRVYKPTAKSLRTIVNYVDPDRRKKAEADATAAGVGIPIPFQIGTVRYTSTQHMAERGGSTDVPVYISPVDFLARRTAVFGMTRTGKSNTTKTMVSQVATTAFQTRQPIGQLIFDINGEYSNANQQDQGSAINDVFPDMTVRYRIMSTPGFRDLRTNFYNDLPMALELIGHEIEQQGRSSGGNDLKNFLSMNLERPPQSDHSEWNHWLRRASIFRAILLSAGYRPDAQNATRQEIEIGKDVLADIVRKGLLSNKLDSSQLGPLPEKPTADALADACRAYFGLERIGTGSRHVASLEDMRTFWRAVREIEMANDGHRNDATAISSKPPKDGRPGTPWLNETERSLLGVLVGKSSTTDGAIIGPSAIGAARDYHGPHGSKEIATEIYSLLKEGRIVILDLSVGNPSIREELSKKLVQEIFQRSSKTFNLGELPPRIVIYVEEAHNLIGKKAELTEIWPRIAKEGAKYGIALVYATQEPSSIHPNILANTENFFVTHLNNDSEIRTLSGFYDFADFAAGLKRSQDVGFARIKTLSASFVTPTQILKFEPARAKVQYEAAKAAGNNDWFTPLPVEGQN